MSKFDTVFSRLIVRFRVNIIYRFGQKDLDIMARKKDVDLYEKNSFITQISGLKTRAKG